MLAAMAGLENSSNSTLWLPEVASPTDLACLLDARRGPQAAFSRLALSRKAFEYTEQLHGNRLGFYALRGQGFSVDGWYHDPARSGAAIAEVRERLKPHFPNLPGQNTFLTELANNFAGLASGLDTRCLTFEPRITIGSEAFRTEIMHTDTGIGMLRSALTYVRGKRTLIARDEDIVDADDYNQVIPVDDLLRPKLAEPPPLSIAAFRAEEKPAWHTINRYTPPGEVRVVIVSRVLARGYQPAIR